MNVLLNGDMSESDGMPVSTTPESTPLNSWQIFTSQGAFNGNVMQGDFDEARAEHQTGVVEAWGGNDSAEAAGDKGEGP